MRRDRCHPSVILWSIGNEIYDMQASEKGQYWTKTLAQEVHRHDVRHAPVTFGSNYMPWEGAQKCADIIRLPGYNYAEKYYGAHHRQHPDWVIYGSETASLVSSRGIYHFPAEQEIMSDEDKHFLGRNDIQFVKVARGCNHCNNTGYSGRISIHEILVVDKTMRKMISNGANTEEIKEYAIQHQGMKTLRDSCIDLIAKGITTMDEFKRVAAFD